LKIRKKGFGKISSYLLAGPSGILIALGIAGIYWNTCLLIVLAILAFVIDYFLDKNLVELES